VGTQLTVAKLNLMPSIYTLKMVTAVESMHTVKMVLLVMVLC